MNAGNLANLERLTLVELPVDSRPIMQVDRTLEFSIAVGLIEVSCRAAG